MPLIIKRLHILLLLIIGLAASQASASYITSKTDGNIVYSLFSSPNEIQRYDMAAEANLESISLNKTPQAFAVADGIAYVAFGRELRAITLSSGVNQFVRNTTTDITYLVVSKENLIIGEDRGSTTLNKLTFQFVESNTQTSSIPHHASSNQQSTFYSQNDSTLQKTTLDSDGKVQTKVTRSHQLGYFSANKLFINTTQTKLYDSSGNIYFADTLENAEKLPENIDHITFIDNNPIALRGDKLTIYTAESVEQGEINLPQKAAFIASYAQKVFSFAPSENNYSTYISDVSKFQLRPLNEALNPADFAYTPEFYSQDDEGNIYLIDRESLNVFRWSTTKNTYLETWPLTAPPTSAAYSTAHKRLYLGYASGKITWLSPAETTPQEHNFTTLTQGVTSLLATGNHLFAVDNTNSYTYTYSYSNSASEYSLDQQGKVIDKLIRNPAIQYLWSPTTHRIYRQRDGLFEWTELNTSTGKFGEDNNPFDYNYYSQNSGLLTVSDDGQYILDHQGQIFDANNRKLVNSLSKQINDSVWINNKPITISPSPTDLSLQLSFWGADFEELSSYPLSKTSHAQLLEVNNNLLLIQQINSKPSFSLFVKGEIPDTDKDQIHDLLDNCTNIANADQTNFDGDNQGDACDDDDDNDSFPDNIESDLNLNPLDPSDAEGDADNDGFSNIVEFVSGSSITDANSLPKALTHYYESFENGWPKGFSNAAGGRAWTLQSEGATGLYSLISPSIADETPEDDINFSAFFNAGQLNFKYKLKKDYANYNSYEVLVLIDDIRTYSLSAYGNDWQTISINLTRGVHKISIRTANTYNVSEHTTKLILDDIKFQSNPFNTDSDGDGLGWDYDNCPLIANENQTDIDSDGLGDACDPVDDRPKDTDLDSIYDESDNCPNIANPNQADLDGDRKGDACDTVDDRPKDSDLDGTDDRWDNCPLISNQQSDNIDGDSFGDACDSDMDGDGVANEVEKTFSFMNERDPADAQKDRDGDGVTNGYEIAHSTKPDVADVFPSISLFDYFPLGEINFYSSFFNGYEYISFVENMKKTDTKNVYLVKSTSPGEEINSQIERKDNGIYVTKTDDAIHNNCLLLPSAMKLGQIITNKCTITPSGNNTAPIESYTTIFELVATTQTKWQGNIYPSLTIKQTVMTDERIISNSETIYLKGIGPAYGFVDLNKIEIINLDKPAQSETADKKKSGGGAIDIWLLISLILFLLASNSFSVLRLRQTGQPN